MLRRSLFLLLILFAGALCAQRATPEAIQRYTQRWITEKYGTPTTEHTRDRDTARALPAPEAGKSLDEIIVSDAEGPESEVSAAINPRDTNKIVAAVMKTTVNSVPDRTTIGVYYSHDSGLTWTRSNFNSDEVVGLFDVKKGGGDPVLTYDKDGHIHLSWIYRLAVGLFVNPRDVTRVYHAVSEDDGVSWRIDSEPVMESEAFAVVSDTIRLEGVFLDKDWLIADNNPSSPNYGNLYLFATRIESPGPNGVGYSILSSTWNATDGWSGMDTVITTEELPFVHFPSPTIAPDGTVYLMVAGATLADEFTAFYLVSSTDGGRNYSLPERISYWNLPCFLQPTAVASCVEGIPAARAMPAGSIYHNPVHDELYAIWYSDGYLDTIIPDTITVYEGMDIYFTVSKDQGANWSCPVTVNTDTVFTSDSFIPTGVVDGAGDFFVTWYDNRAEDGGTDYYGRRYDPGSETFGEEFVITTSRTDFATVGNANSGFGVGEYNTTIATDSTLLPIWADGRSNDGNLNVRIARINKIDKLTTGQDSSQCVVTSVNSLRNDGMGLRLAPNPVTGPLQLTLELEAGTTGIRAEIIDAQGRLVRQLTLPGRLTAGEHRFTVPTVGLSPAPYFLSVYSARSGRVSKTFVKR